MKPDICIFHSPCADGFGAAWVVWKKYGDAVKFHAGVYGQDPPDVSGKNVVLVDFSYKRGVLEQMGEAAQSLVILDHHKTAEEEIAALEPTTKVLALFDMHRSGAQITWDYFMGTKRPRLIDYIGDRDLWRFKLPRSRDVAAALFSFPYDFKVWDNLINACEQDESLQAFMDEGAAIERKHMKDVHELLEVTRRSMVIGGVPVPVANIPYTMASDGAGQMAAEPGVRFAATYHDVPGARVFSLRSRGLDGADVSAVAQQYGGGGHKNAAGFKAPPGWEGEGK